MPSLKEKTTLQGLEDMAMLPGLLADHQIRDLARNKGMIDPFVEKQTREGVISYGLSSYGYDARCSADFKIFTKFCSYSRGKLSLYSAQINLRIDFSSPICLFKSFF